MSFTTSDKISKGSTNHFLIRGVVEEFTLALPSKFSPRILHRPIVGFL